MKNAAVTTIILLSALSALAPSLARAHAECAGETYGNTIVKVEVQTVGTMGGLRGGQVTIVPKDGPERTYEIRRDEIPQFYESTDGEPERAIVGLAAYLDAEFPVQIRYVGPNTNTDLTRALRNPARKKVPGNSLVVWKGPGFAGDQQYSFTDVVCAVSLDP